MIAGEVNSEGVTHFPYARHERVVDDFVRIAYDLDLVIPFNWSEWTEGDRLVSNPHTNFNDLDLITLVKLITALIRSDKYSGGTVVGAVQNGIILKILRAIDSKI
ncbi:MAG TPA: hypothetical protein ENI20_15465 [Bacteroides sp.]|nr:hypothetical protein [Bacteroides sp.]